MKLAPILFVERAPTAGEALASGVVGVLRKMGPTNFAVYLVNAHAFRELVKKHSGTIAKIPAERMSYIIRDRVNLSNEDYENTIRGYVEVGSKGKDLYSVKYSVGLDKYGPLAYRVAMEIAKAKKGWLRSDSYVSKHAKRVWNKMYELSEQGAYKRKFLGAFGVDEVIKSLSVDGAPPEIRSPAFYAKVKRIAADGGTSTEKLFLQELAAAGVSPSEVGWFWAYQTTRKDPQSNKLLAGGEGMLLASATETQPMVDKPRLEAVIDHMAARLFSRKFDEDV